MAELLIADGYSPPDRLAVRLREDLPADHVAVAGAQIQGKTCDAIVVAPQGLTVLHHESLGEAFTQADAVSPATASAPAGAVERKLRLFSSQTQACDRAMSTFLRDEFPLYRPEIRHIAIVDGAQATNAAQGRTDQFAVALDRVGEAILSVKWIAADPVRSDEARAELAEALCERRLTSRQRASAPFIFRSDGWRSHTRTAWTIRDVVEHMDRFPDDGVYHLRNGTVVRWFDEQGAAHMVRHCQEAMRAPTADSRALLEDFLLRTGLVESPKFEVRPKVVDLGAVAAGEKSSTWIRVVKAKGRGYLTGALRSTEPWLKVEPSTFEKGEYAGLITVDTSSLQIRSRPYSVSVEMRSNSAESPYSIPVRFRVTPAYSVRMRQAGWVTIAAVVAGLVGAVIGWLWGAHAVPGLLASVGLGPGGFEDILASPAVWSMLVGLLWALVAAIHGFRSDIRSYAGTGILRWSVYLVTWTAIAFLFAAVPVWALEWIDPGRTPASDPSVAVTAGLTMALFSVLPALLIDRPDRKLRSSVAVDREAERARRRRRLLNLGVAGVAVVALLLVSLRWSSVSPWLVRTEGWFNRQAMVLEERLDEWTDTMTLRYYDRRAPAMPTLAPALLPTPTPDVADEAVAP